MMSVAELHIRAALLRAVRTFFFKQQFLEVETPIRYPVIVPEANIQPLKAGDQYLQSSPELCMKRLLAGGCTKIFQICPCFRKEERGRFHLEEFTMLEWYRTGSSYFDLMQDCEKLLVHIGQELTEEFPELVASGKLQLFGVEKAGEYLVEKITVAEAFTRWSPVALEFALQQNRFDELLVEYIEPRLGVCGVAFLYDYPVALASLARRKNDHPELAERFEMYMGGVEIANGFSELTDADEQRSRFEEERRKIHADSGQHLEMPEKFLEALNNLPECAGIALGVDRLFMHITGKSEINGAVAFSPDDL